MKWAAAPNQAASLRVDNGNDVYDVGTAPYHLFGRDAAMGCQIIVDDPAVSRRHAALVHHQDGRIYVIDLASVGLDTQPQTQCPISIFPVFRSSDHFHLLHAERRSCH